MTEISDFFSEIQTDRLTLRNLREVDTEFILRHFSDQKITQYLMDAPPVSTIEEAKAIVDYYLAPEMKNHNRWIILKKEDQSPIGTCGFHKWDKIHLHAEIGYDLAVNYWGHGFMSEALDSVISTAFKRMKLNRINALVYVGNFRSISLLERLRFKKEGMLREYYCANNKFYDHLYFGLLQSEWERC